MTNFENSWGIHMCVCLTMLNEHCPSIAFAPTLFKEGAENVYLLPSAVRDT
jgi:hypothetical protein